MLRKQIIAKLFRLCLKLTQRRRFELHSSNRPQRSVDVFCVSLNFVKHKVGVTAWKLRLSKLLQHLSAGRVLESDSSLIIMIQFRLGYGWLVLIDFRRTYVQTHKLGLFSLLLQKQTKKKTHFGVNTVLTQPVAHYETHSQTQAAHSARGHFTCGWCVEEGSVARRAELQHVCATRCDRDFNA